MSRPKKAWMLQILSQAEMGNVPEAEQIARIKAAYEKLSGCGIQQFKMDDGPLAQISYQISGELARKHAGETHA